MHIYDSLLAMDTEFNIYPWLATSWELSEDMLGYIFTLRDDVTFHDGTPFNAEAVKFTFDRIVLPETGATSAAVVIGQFYETTEVIDDYTVEVRFTAPYAPFLGGVTTAFLGIVSPTAAQESGPDFAANPVGTGPFVFQEWVAQQSTTLAVNPDYNWASDIFSHNGPAYIQEIRFQYVPESATRQALLDTGEAQYIDQVPPQNVATIEGNSDFQMLIAPRPGGPKMVDLNTAKPPLDQLEVRQALNFGTNKEEMMDTIFFGVFEPAGSPLAPATFGYEPGVEDMYPYDVEQATALLDQSGWVMGDNGIRQKDGQEFRLNCLIGQSEEDAAIAQVLQAQWQPLGVAVDINVIAGTALTEAKRSGEHNIGFKIAVYQDPDILGAYFHPASVGGFNYTFYDDPELAELLDRGVSTLDPEERQQVYSELSFFMMENALLIPLYYLSNLTAATATLQGLIHDTAGYWWFYDAWFQEG
jgi:peptide/nickel transport system substrate-binding protein